MIRRTLSLMAALLVATPIFAHDARLVTHRYDAEEVVRIAGQLGVQASIAFNEDEHIENVAIGDSASWQITPNKRANLLFVKPLEARARTNMTVVTDRHTYFFDLIAGPSATPLYVLRFSYPDEPKKEPTQQLAGTGGATTEELQALRMAPVEAPVDPATLNFAWQARGKSALLPSRVYDDGDSVYLAWPPKASMPAIQVRNDKGVEGPVNFAVRGDVIVMEGVPRVIILRSGNASAELRNTGPERKVAEPAKLAVATPAAEPPAALAPAPKGQ